MKKLIHNTRILLWLLILAIAAPTLVSCGTIRTYGGIEHESRYDFDGHGYYKHHKKHKKHKKQHKKHHKHHHHHDD